MHDGLANGGPDGGKERVGERPRVAAHRGRDGLLDGRRERAGELRVARPFGNRVGQHQADVAQAHARVGDPRAQGPELHLLRPDEQRAELGEPGLVGHRTTPAGISVGGP